MCSQTIFAGTPATTHRSGTSARTTEPAATTTTLRPIRAPGKTITPIPEPRARADADRPVHRNLSAARGIRVLAAMILIGDVDVGAGLHVIADRRKPGCLHKVDEYEGALDHLNGTRPTHWCARRTHE